MAAREESAHKYFQEKRASIFRGNDYKNRQVFKVSLMSNELLNTAQLDLRAAVKLLFGQTYEGLESCTIQQFANSTVHREVAVAQT